MLSPIKVLLVEDSPVATIVLKRILNSAPEIQVVGTACNGLEALELIPNLQPQVICTDLNMAQMNGLEFTQEVMKKYPRPILIISASVQAKDTQNVFELMKAGALDVFPKPIGGLASDYDRLANELIAKVKVLSGVKVFTRHQRLGSIEKSDRPIPKINQLSMQNYQLSSGTLKSQTIKLLAVGASTGGPQALHSIISQFPANLPVPVICIQHISEGFLQGLVEWLGCESKLPVKIAGLGEFPQAGIVYFPPEKRHLELDYQGRFIYSEAASEAGHCPSVTVTFKSVANFYGRAAAGVLLTGMGRDGAEGMLAIARLGGLTIAQDEGSCVVFGMPKEAIALGAAQYILPVSAIAPLLLAKLKV
ncbi:chemotaxis-specific protein-glutamate methyltransferase CheB [Microcoleus sp. LEGE 07076]|uniref:chemotaxis-specific protein-glutamate methyltransferase CheB n=1 Tax=Microcoleus sp. LEGE 07076 TaxID=915322 RepID=UPI001882BCBA|nr:chemotaxis-specific protein-glutamate methyltransferase CheB [Microcoleus sp. LEGE 07076]MBE9184057.1 chemotaxis-specific protein-glutamate methyltransferase CheB [Microcoleus sp. LEGE 07076]